MRISDWSSDVCSSDLGGAVIAGVPMLHVNIAGLTGAEQATCTTNLVQLACDPIYFLAIGHRPAGQARWDIIDDQITPVRGFGQHDLEMKGIAERLVEGEQVERKRKRLNSSH